MDLELVEFLYNSSRKVYIIVESVVSYLCCGLCKCWRTTCRLEVEAASSGPVTSRRSVDGGHEISIVAARGWAQWRTGLLSEIMGGSVQEP